MRSRMDTSLWSRENIAWLAGLIEGEGCILVGKRENGAKSFRIAVNMTDKDVLCRVAEISGIGSVRGPFQPVNAKHKPFYRWNINRGEYVMALLSALYPFMGERRKGRINEAFAAFRLARKAWSHGTRQGYEVGCRCHSCRAIHATRTRRLRVRRNVRREQELANGE